MGRAIVREPKAFLMDEPLSNLDAKLRVSMRAELAKLHERLRVTTVYVTHDQVEAMTLGQRVAVLRDGVLQQVDTPQNLFRRPANLFVAAFIGSPSMNLVDAELADGRVSFAGYSFAAATESSPAARVHGGSVILGIRPTDFEHGESAEPDLPRVTVQPDVVEDLGSQIARDLHDRRAPRERRGGARRHGRRRTTTGSCSPTSGPIFTAGARPPTRSSRRERGRARGRRDRLHFFDPATGRALGGGVRSPLAA